MPSPVAPPVVSPSASLTTTTKVAPPTPSQCLAKEGLMFDSVSKQAADAVMATSPSFASSTLRDPSRHNFPPISSNYSLQHRSPPEVRVPPEIHKETTQAVNLASSSSTKPCEQSSSSSAAPSGHLASSAAIPNAVTPVAHADSVKSKSALNSIIPPAPHDTDATVDHSTLGVDTTTVVNYAAAVKPQSMKKPDVPANRFRALNPVREGDIVTLPVPPTPQHQLDDFKHHALIGRLILRKGCKPRPFAEFTRELQRIWDCSNCKFVPMAKGYFTARFATLEDKLRVKSTPVQELSSGHIRLREWVRYFDPYKESSSLAQI